jgi:hypothetical protein
MMAYYPPPVQFHAFHVYVLSQAPLIEHMLEVDPQCSRRLAEALLPFVAVSSFLAAPNLVEEQAVLS